MKRIEKGKKTVTTRISIEDFYRGKELLKFLDSWNRHPAVLHLVIALVLLANDEKVTLEQVVQMLEAANNFSPEKPKVADLLRQLGHPGE